jgi:hypothetical protein
MDLRACNGYCVQFSGAMAGTALEMAGMDRYVQLQQDQVPFKVRAKRGCATHPRSIAERVRAFVRSYMHAQTLSSCFRSRKQERLCCSPVV